MLRYTWICIVECSFRDETQDIAGLDKDIAGWTTGIAKLKENREKDRADSADAKVRDAEARAKALDARVRALEKTLESSGDETKRGSATLASVSAALNRANADLEAERRRREEARRVSRDLETLAALETSRADAAERDAEARAPVDPSLERRG